MEKKNVSSKKRNGDQKENQKWYDFGHVTKNLFLEEVKNEQSIIILDWSQH